MDIILSPAILLWRHSSRKCITVSLWFLHFCMLIIGNFLTSNTYGTNLYAQYEAYSFRSHIAWCWGCFPTLRYRIYCCVTYKYWFSKSRVVVFWQSFPGMSIASFTVIFTASISLTPIWVGILHSHFDYFELNIWINSIFYL